jgi:hypothetical protein
MHCGKAVFAQLMDWIHPEQFNRCVTRYRGNQKVRQFSCWDQFLAMAFAQVTFRESLADIEICLRSRRDQLYHLGFRSSVAHSTLADANAARDWRIYADLAQGLIRRARKLYAQESLGLELDQTVYALDSTTIDLCLTLFPWARFRSTKAAVKLHTLLDLRGPIPTMIAISDGKQADVRVLDELIPEPGASHGRSALSTPRINTRTPSGLNSRHCLVCSSLPLYSMPLIHALSGSPWKIGSGSGHSHHARPPAAGNRSASSNMRRRGFMRLDSWQLESLSLRADRINGSRMRTTWKSAAEEPGFCKRPWRWSRV